MQQSVGVHTSRECLGVNACDEGCWFPDRCCCSRLLNKVDIGMLYKQVSMAIKGQQSSAMLR